MVVLTKFVKILCKPSEEHVIEQLVEDISNNLFINEVYYGNILTSLSLLFDYVVENQFCKQIFIHYNTDYKIVKLVVSGIEQDVIMNIVRKKEITETEISEDIKNIFLIQSLTDDIFYSLENEEITLVYDISAVHDKVYNERKEFLERYFHKTSNIEATPEK